MAEGIERKFLVVGDLPARSTNRAGVWDEVIQRVKTELQPGQWACIASYPKPNQASAAATGLRQKYGSTSAVSGLEFATRRLEVSKNGDKSTGVFASFDAKKISKEAAAKFADERAARLEKYKAQARQRTADKKAAKK